MAGNKNYDAILQDKLYNNILLLTHFYPTSPQFKEAFKKDMFAKNNKTAFFQMVHYLLTVLNPELTNKKLTNWPVYDIKSETKFRVELLQYINELNTLYENADIPTIMTSHLISPGGFKFLKFMFKLSQLVLYEHLQRSNPTNKTILLKPKASKSNTLTTEINKNLQKCVNEVEDNVRTAYKKHKEYIETSKKEADDLCKLKHELNEKLVEIDNKHKEITTIFNENYSSFPDLTVAKEKINQLSTNESVLSEIKEKLNTIKTLTTYLLEGKNVLFHRIINSESDLKENVSSVLNADQLDFLNFLKVFTTNINQINLEIPYLTTGDLENVTERVKVLKKQYEETLNILLQEKTHMDNYMENLGDYTSCSSQIVPNNEDSEPLATPLEYASFSQEISNK